MESPKPDNDGNCQMERHERLQRDLAARASDPRVASIHMALADRYADRSFDEIHIELGDDI